MYSREITTMVVCAALLPPLLAACSSDDEQLGNGGETQQEIRIKVGASNYVEVTRATTYEPGSTLESMMLGANMQGSSTVYFDPELVTCTSNVWSFDGGKRYWPMSSTSALDFYAYMPATLPNYISDVAYDGSVMSFTCTGLPVTAAAQGSSMKEFVCAVTKDVAQSTSSGTVSLAMQHPFARIRLRWAEGYDHSDITVNSITLKNIKNNGTVTFNGSISTTTWTPTGDATNFVATAPALDNYAASLTSYLVVPQTFAGEIEVNATWKEWDHDVNHTVSTTLASRVWEAGKSYTYDFTITQTDLKVTTTNEFAEQW